jgi:hypothetical protein
MNKINLYLLLSALIHSSLHGQTRLPEISLNHIYVVLDSVTYSHLFDSSFIEQKLGNVKAASVTTTDESWSGKYLLGKNSYFEFFSTKSFEGAREGDCGFGFITSTSGDIRKIEKDWRETANDSIQTDTTNQVTDGKSQPWFYSLYYLPADSTLPVSAWVMENTPEELRSIGFSDQEIRNEINWQQYAEKRNKKVFTKCFDHIQTVYLSLTDKEYEYLKKSFTGFGLQHQNNIFFNNHVKIICSIEDKASPVLKRIEIALTETFEARSIKISSHLTLEIRKQSDMDVSINKKFSPVCCA